MGAKSCKKEEHDQDEPRFNRDGNILGWKCSCSKFESGTMTDRNGVLLSEEDRYFKEKEIAEINN